MKKVICIALSMVFLFMCTVVAFADVELLPSGVVSWSDVGEDGLKLANTYLELLKSKSGKEFFKNVSDIPTAWLQTLSDGSWALSPVDDYYYFLKDGILQVGDKSGGGGGKDVTTPEDFYFPSDTIINYIEEQNTLATPKGKDLFKQSYRSDTVLHSNYYSYYITVWDNPIECTFLSDLYFLPFVYKDGQLQAISNYQIRLTIADHDDPNADVCIKREIYKFVSGVGYVIQPEYSGLVAEFSSSSMPFALGLDARLYSPQCVYYATENDYLNNRYNQSISPYIPSNISDRNSYVFSDGTNVSVDSSYFNDAKYSANKDKVSDYGFYTSQSLISRTFDDIDTSKIPPNQVINITGDTIYDYSITNPDTGASTTINEYVTNNYIYPEVPSTSEPAAGGSGGDVTVGGNISVGGQVGVDITVSVPDININVNQGSGAGGSGTVVNPDDILNGSSVDLDKYYDDAISQASGVRSFLTQFFDFLPAEIIGLLGMLIAVAIVCRIFGR